MVVIGLESIGMMTGHLWRKPGYTDAEHRSGEYRQKYRFIFSCSKATFSRGRTPEHARTIAEKVRFDITQRDSLLILPKGFPISSGEQIERSTRIGSNKSTGRKKN